jgi:hypothetical protein
MNVHNRLICQNWRGNVDMQIILDQHAAINYMVKYATKGEKAGDSLSKLFYDIIGSSSEEDNPTTKLRSLMLKSIAGKRDIGQCEVSRLLFSDNMYHSSFSYISQTTDLDSREVNIQQISDENAPATKKSMIDYFAHRKSDASLQPYLNEIVNLVEFARLFQIKNNSIIQRPDAYKTVVVTYPRVRYNPNNIEKLKEYCYRQMIKYSSWDISNIDVIRDKNTAIQRWNTFLKTASPEILATIK